MTLFSIMNHSQTIEPLFCASIMWSDSVIVILALQVKRWPQQPQRQAVNNIGIFQINGMTFEKIDLRPDVDLGYGHMCCMTLFTCVL